MGKVNWKIEGMTCSNCALTISKYLKNEGIAEVKVDLVGGEVMFDLSEKEQSGKLQKGIEKLGYKVIDGDAGPTGTGDAKTVNRFLRYVLWCGPFTLILMGHFLGPRIGLPLLQSPWVQFVLCLPVYVIGMRFFGRSALQSLRNRMPNMNVLVALGATAAFVYSLTGTLLHLGDNYIFYETAAAIITLVFLGNYLEEVSIHSTQRALDSLARSQNVMASMIAFDGDHQEVILPIENTQLREGDLILIKSGEQVPADCKILWGDASVNEAIITGESLPLEKHARGKLIGGSLLTGGTVKAQVTAAASHSVLANIVNLVKQAQGEKPPVQQFADKISAIFVPTVLMIALVTGIVNFWILRNFTEALMRSIAVLVIACPCAMGLATPAAIAVGLGRAAKKGILFRHARGLELFKSIRQVVFDKTGTLTTGDFEVSGFVCFSGDMETFKRIAWSLEKYSQHPIARCITARWKSKGEIRWAAIEEIKGLGMKGTTPDGTIYRAGSYTVAGYQTTDDTHNVYILKNEELLGWIDVRDEIRPEAISVVQYLRHHGIRTVLLSGDRETKCRQLAGFVGIDEVIAEKSPEEKLEVMENLTLQAPTAMVGDGINDAPALAKATIGISMIDASQLAMQTADVVLMNHGLKNIPLSLGLGKHTFLTIRQNLFWAFFYNIIAIPVAAFGLLTPTFGALAMALSDVVLAGNSVRLFVKRVV